MGLLRLSISPYVSVACALQRMGPFHLSHQICGHKVISIITLSSFLLRTTILTMPLSFLLLLICDFFFKFCQSDQRFTKCFIFPINQTLVSLISCTVFLILILLLSAPLCTISFLLLAICLNGSSFSRFRRQKYLKTIEFESFLCPNMCI